jgi:hypothetical protein
VVDHTQTGGADGRTWRSQPRGVTADTQIAMAVSRDDVVRKVGELFPDSERASMLRLLDRYPGDTPEGRARVQLAILKLAKGQTADLKDWVDVACVDFRDVLASAEYPRQFKLSFVDFDALPAPDRARIVAEDRAEYLAWLDSGDGPGT